MYGAGSFSPDGTRVVTISVDNTARVWDVMAGLPSDWKIISEASDATGGYTLNDFSAAQAIGDAAVRRLSLRQKVAGERLGEPTAASFLRWLFDDPLDTHYISTLRNKREQLYRGAIEAVH